MVSSNSIKVLLKQACKQLEHISDSAMLDAELLLAYCLEKNRSYLHTWPEVKLNKTQLENYNALITKRATDYPVAYLLGTKAFWTLDLTVSPDVLIPRPETELLVEISLEIIKDIKTPKILDLGTGSGAIALALASEREDAAIYASDNSKNALQVAKHNAVNLKLDQQVTFLHSNWFDEISKTNFDIIVSNPPYIDPKDTHLSESIRFEPQQALISENKGMQDIENIIKESPHFLANEGYIVFEHGYDQADKVTKLLQLSPFTAIKSNLDLNNHYRVTYGKFK